MPENKAPGLDGFTVAFFKFFWNDIKDDYFNSIVASLNKGKMNISQHRGVITLLPKRNKPTQFVHNWRPITLLNVDYKIIAKAIASRMKPLLHKVIHDYQKGFIPQRFIGENIIDIYTILDKIEEEDMDALLISVDFYKAFHSIEWSFINNVLDFFDFPQYIKFWFNTPYNDLNGRVKVNGTLSPEFSISKGVKQDSPLSLILFILSLEIFARAIRENLSIKGIPSSTQQDRKIDLLADDTMLSILASNEALAEVISTLKALGEISGLTVNLDKSVISWLSPSKSEKLSAEQRFQWSTKGCMHYLGINLSLDNTDLNYIFSSIRATLDSIRCCNWKGKYRLCPELGKVVSINQFFMSKLVYQLSLIPSPLIELFNEIRTVFNKFLWTSRHKVQFNVAAMPTEHGGFATPHIQLHNDSLKLV